MSTLELQKSSRHSDITGKFGERLIQYFLSKMNYEVCYVDHTGIDLIATNLTTNETIGISVKSRSRLVSKIRDRITIKPGNYEQITKACKDFNVKPWLALIIDEPLDAFSGKIRVIILSVEKLLSLYPNFQNGKSISFNLSKASLTKYCNDPDIHSIILDYSSTFNK